MNRTSGILLPISSLPSKYGIGCFSKEAYDFVDLIWLYIGFVFIVQIVSSKASDILFEKSSSRTPVSFINFNIL